ncbi:cellobiose transport system permease protein, partial [Nocardioides terrae]
MTEHSTLPTGDAATAAPPAGGIPDIRHEGRATMLRPTWRERRSRWDVRVSPYLYVSPFFVLFAVIGLFPLGYTAYLSLYDWQPLASHKGAFLGLENYSKVLGDPVFTKALVNTISIFLLSSVPQVIIAVVIAALLDNRLRGSTLWRMSVLLPFVAAPA